MFDVISSSRRRSPSGFSPLDLSPSIWLDASDASTLYDATTGGSLVEADGSIARWEDKSGNGLHMTQATSTARPLRRASFLSRGGIEFTELNNKKLQRTSVNCSGWNIWIVISANANNPAASTFIGHSGYYVDRVFAYSLNPSTDKIIRLSSLTSTESTCVWRVNNLGPYAASTANDLINRVDSQRIYETSALPTIAAAGTLSIAGMVTLTERNWYGKVCEIIAMPTEPTTTQRNNVITYLKAKWSIA